MLLVVDVGNTHTVAGIYPLDSPAASDPTARWRWQTQRAATSDEVAAMIGQMLALDASSLDDVQRLAISSVVPGLTTAWRDLGARLLGERGALVVGPGLRTGLRISTSEPHEVGADRIVNAVAAWHRYEGPCIVVDLGTATTYDVIVDPATYIGGAIAPGIAVSVGALVDRAARLASVDLHMPDTAIGRDTASSMRSGVMLGAVAQLEGMLARIRAELVAEHGVSDDHLVPAIATGGFSTMLHGHVTGLDDVDVDLTLRGLQLLALHR
ncbi:MAG: type pantothenate kinase [Thermoleophilia bacterium]|nr:type pantothenate kinase [Thermoleophilia bacterium]